MQENRDLCCLCPSLRTGFRESTRWDASIGGHGSAQVGSSGGPAVSGRQEETVNSVATGAQWQCIHTKFILPADTHDAAGAADAGRNGGGSSRSIGGGGCSAAGGSGGDLQLCVLRHGWRDPLLLELEAYRRAESLLPTAACSSAESAYCGAGADTDSGAEAAAAGGAEAPEAAAVTAGEAHGARGAGAAAHRWAADDAAALVRPMSLPRSPDIASHVDQLAVGLLNVMLAAIRVRCACIEPRSPHPSAAYGAAVAKAAAAAAAATVAAEGSSCPPWPSWRASDPQAYNAAAVAMPTGAVASVTGGAAPLAPQPAPPVMILFSGGVDSVLLAALAHRALPLDFPIDLCNVCFDGGKSPDRGAARCALRELAQACPGRPWRLLEVDATLEDVDRHKMRILSLLRPAHTVMDLNIGAALWLAASGQGNLRLPPPPPCHSVADAATVPAAAAAEGPASTSGEALRVAGSRAAASAGSGASNGPSSEEVLLPYYGSPARVVLLGHGADEQCGGYGRHRTRFRLGSSEPHDGAAAATAVDGADGADGCVGDEGATTSIGEAGGWRALAAELELDVRRLWIRNLGRDDRLVSDWGREARHPFLDESVMQLLRRARLSSVVDFSQPPGRGDKQVLRRALALLGLPEAASRVKRAIQFGSRIGKQHNRREFGSNRAANRQNAGGVALQDVTKAAAEAVSKAWVKPPKGQRGG